jgi:hypothetical protein
MVRRVLKDGSVIHHGPYTEEEQEELGRRMGNGPVAFTRPGPAPAAAPAPAPQQQPLAKRPSRPAKATRK